MSNTKSKSSLKRWQKRKSTDDTLSTRSKVIMDKSRSHSLASDISSRIGSDSLTLIQQLEIIRGTVCQPKSLTPDQLAMVKITWQTVLSDSSNICLNFFHQLHRRFPQIQRMQQNQGMAHSTPSLPCTIQLSKRTLSCSLDPQKQSQLPQHSLKLACCIDKLIGSLFTGHSIDKKVVYMLQDYGIIFKNFLGLDSLFTNWLIVREMSNEFTESLRLILIYNWFNSGIRWDVKLNEAWTAFFQILLFYLDGIDD
jgi:hypothetical protein